MGIFGYINYFYGGAAARVWRQLPGGRGRPLPREALGGDVDWVLEAEWNIVEPQNSGGSGKQ